MSIEAAQSFVEKMKTDQDFAKQVIACKDNVTRLAFAFEQGFDFTAEEIQTIKAELSDDELEMIAGGFVKECEEDY